MKRVLPWMVLAAASLAAIPPALAMDEAGYGAAKAQIGADYKDHRHRCNDLKANARDVCLKEARGRKKIALADLHARYAPSDRATYLAQVARADVAYAVAQEKCEDRAGQARAVCKKDAKALHVRALEDAEVARIEARMADTPAARDTAVAAARKKAATERRARDYEAARERCKAMQADARAQCLTDARRVYGPDRG